MAAKEGTTVHTQYVVNGGAQCEGEECNERFSPGQPFYEIHGIVLCRNCYHVLIEEWVRQ